MEKKDSEYIYFRKTLNHIDNFIQECFITPNGFITHQNNPKHFNRYLKLALRNQCPFESVFLLSEETEQCLYDLVESSQYLSFSYTENLNFSVKEK